MAGYFLDTSALVKRYQAEIGTAAVDAIFAEADRSLLVSRLGLVEAVSALALKVRTGEIQLPDFSIARKKLLGDVKGRSLAVVRVLVGHYRYAEQLIERYGLTRRLRTLDAVQLAIALECEAKGRVQSFVCADALLCEIAELEGMRTLVPT
jgi:predicted nucleic acid-binding protein